MNVSLASVFSFIYLTLIHSYLCHAWLNELILIHPFLFHPNHHFLNTCSMSNIAVTLRFWRTWHSPCLVWWRSESLRFCHLQTFLQSGKNIVFPSWFPGQWFGLFLRKDSPWTLGSPRALGLKSGYWFPFGPCPTVGLKSVISFCILDCKANTFSPKCPNLCWGI